MIRHANLVFLFGSLIGFAATLKTWIQNTGIDNPINWNVEKVPVDCDRLSFPVSSDIATYWNIKKIAISGLTLPKTGEILLPDNIDLRLKDEVDCPKGRDLKYTRSGMKGWLDGDNWKSDGTEQWLPDSERIPCAGEEIHFPSDNTIAVSLPNVLLPVNRIKFGERIFGGEEWQRFLSTKLGLELFKGPQDLRSYPWRTDLGCSNKKKCTCIRSAYAFYRNGMYKEMNPLVLEEAICLHARPKCPAVDCYSPVMPEGHCCGICGAVLNLEDRSENGIDLNEIKSRVKEELIKNKFEKELKTYAGRTKDGNIQVVVVAENSDAMISSRTLANAIARNLADRKLQSRLTSQFSGLTFSKYVFNNISGVFFGTFIAVLSLFAALFYAYVIFPNKKFTFGKNNPFVFARFDNTVNEDSSDENLEIGIEPEEGESPVQAFDNPIYSKNIDINVKSYETPKINEEENKIQEKSGAQEYHNLVYNNMEKTTNKVDVFEGLDKKEEEEDNENEILKGFEEFSEIDL